MEFNKQAIQLNDDFMIHKIILIISFFSFKFW